MAHVVFTSHLSRFLDAGERDAPGISVREVLESAFAGSPRLRGYVLDDQGALRKYVVVFVNGEMVRDRAGLTDPVGPAAEVYVMQSLAGG